MQNLDTTKIPALEILRDRYSIDPIRGRQDAHRIVNNFLEERLSKKDFDAIRELFLEVLYVERAHMVNQVEKRTENLKAFEL